ncbi:MAG: serine/threonine protein kinase [Planctomycetes bacterium]|nr:serine/threonine protein kinase [Planctomycetota bacterium]
MPVNRYDRLFAHIASITGLLTAAQIEQLFRAVEAGEARDMATAASRGGALAGDVSAAIAILASELASRRIAENIEPATIVASGKTGPVKNRDSQLYPRALGEYRNLKQVARGAMGIIFRGEHRNGRVVALKVLPVQMVREPQDIERFKREVETITSLMHPNIVRVFDFGQDEDFYYYAMEFLDGRSLRELVQDRGHLSPFHAAEIVRDAARGLAYAHQHGVIHRDVKPSNVMICKDGQVKLVDFGLAFQKASDVLTATGISLGTPAYMSPEQIEGGRAEVNERSDIYSLGVTLYEAATGHRPFEGDNQYDVMKRVLFDVPQAAQEANPATPPELSRIIGKAMAKNPTERYASVGDMIRDLDVFLEATGKQKQRGAVG